MSNITIQEEYSLPSKGMLYGKQFDPTVKLRSMTVAEEMKRLSATDYPYKNMSEIIDDCIVNKLPISSYDMCLGDYQYLLHRLRVVTYGPDYKISMACPFCGELFDYTINLDELEVFEYDESIKELLKVELPSSNHIIDLRLQTPRDLDRIENKKKEMKKQFPDMKYDPTLLLNLESLIGAIDGQPINVATIQTFIENLPMRDTNILIQKAQKLNEKVGVDTIVTAHCPNCDHDVFAPFRFTNEFFRPEVD